jgi:RimJ/RimL family protein N-acetyltransferase
LYEKLGFEKVGEVRQGVGLVDEGGKSKEGGEGFVDRGMVWRPEGYMRPL